MGTGDPDLTWQGKVGMGYSFDSVDVIGVWRYLDYDLGDSTGITAINFNGPVVGVTFLFWSDRPIDDWREVTRQSHGRSSPSVSD